ncbi:MAG: hypothetical protein GX117_00850 [Candidatus Hydrogenedentes bacterium]|jgi:hypothetical protein|nr:hypothetical protein [Candidatus Hydrogenedentota bacterium]
MQAEDRVIHFCVELIHQPRPLQRPNLQKLYYKLSQSKTAYNNIDLNDPNQAKFHSQRGKAQSLLIFLPDRVLMVEEWADIPQSSFEEKIKSACPQILKAREVSQIVLHSVTIRSTFALTHFDDARQFLLDNACGLEGKINPYFQRPVATGGLRFVFPETKEHAGVLHLNIESFRHSTNEIFVEVKGIFGRRPLSLDSMDVLVESLKQTRHFITERVRPFLQQFDLPSELS